MTCKDCIHFVICDSGRHIGEYIKDDCVYSDGVEKECEGFKNKSDFIEVKHSEWIIERDCAGVTYRCPICKFELTLADPEEKLEYKGCPMCLSLLKEGADNDR